MNSGELFKWLVANVSPTTPVVVRTRVKTGYDEGDIYESEDFTVEYRNGKVIIEPRVQTLVGGW